jgi:hypothetical protein
MLLFAGKAESIIKPKVVLSAIAKSVFGVLQ